MHLAPFTYWLFTHPDKNPIRSHIAPVHLGGASRSTSLLTRPSQLFRHHALPRLLLHRRQNVNPLRLPHTLPLCRLALLALQTFLFSLLPLHFLLQALTLLLPLRKPFCFFLLPPRLLCALFPLCSFSGFLWCELILPGLPVSLPLFSYFLHHVTMLIFLLQFWPWIHDRHVRWWGH